MTVKLKPLTPEEITNRVAIKEEMRHSLGWIPAECFPKALEEIEYALRTRSIEYTVYKDSKQKNWIQLILNIESIPELAAKCPSNEEKLIDFFTESVIVKNAYHSLQYDPARIAVWICFTAKKKVLTAFRKWCLKELFAVEKRKC